MSFSKKGEKWRRNFLQRRQQFPGHKPHIFFCEGRWLCVYRLALGRADSPGDAYWKIARWLKKKRRKQVRVWP